MRFNPTKVLLWLVAGALGTAVLWVLITIPTIPTSNDWSGGDMMVDRYVGYVVVQDREYEAEVVYQKRIEGNQNRIAFVTLHPTNYPGTFLQGVWYPDGGMLVVIFTSPEDGSWLAVRTGSNWDSLDESTLAKSRWDVKLFGENLTSEDFLKRVAKLLDSALFTSLNNKGLVERILVDPLTGDKKIIYGGAAGATPPP